MMFSRTSAIIHQSITTTTTLRLNLSRNARTTTVASFPQVRHRSNRSRRGLYDGKDIRTGNNVSFSMRATKRTFKPNVKKKRVYSEILDAMLPFHLTTAALRSIDKAGGLDNYLLHSDKVTSGEGLKAKQKILRRLKNKAWFERKNAERGEQSTEQAAT